MDKILILDFGSQVTQLIARRVRELGVYSEVHPFDVSDKFIQDFGAVGIILSGGPESVTEEGSPRAPQAVFSLGVPLLGICYGMQTMAEQLGGRVQKGEVREFGYAEVEFDPECALLGMGQDNEALNKVVWMSHGDKVTKLPPDFKKMAYTKDCEFAGMSQPQKKWYGVQFHPEVTHTKEGLKIFKRFIFDICRAKADWTMPHYIEESVTKIRETVGDQHVILGLSGGVDSSVAAALIHKAIGSQLTCIFVDHGLLRLNEGQSVVQTFRDNMKLNLIAVDAKDRFYNKLAGIQDPEQKRKIIGAEFINVFDEEAKKIKNAVWLAQGTIYPDVIESASSKTKKAHTIKSHHNVGGLPEKMGLKLLEPLRDLFKDEVRALGVELGLPRGMVYRHPFPGPGLAVRILGDIKPLYVDLLQRADAIFIDELEKTKATEADVLACCIDSSQVGKTWLEITSQAFTVFLPVKSVGVMGDGRTYDYVVSLRAVITSDFMTAEWARLPYSLLSKVSGRIINEVRGINRVVYDVSSKPPATIEWE